MLDYLVRANIICIPQRGPQYANGITVVHLQRRLQIDDGSLIPHELVEWINRHIAWHVEVVNASVR